jgi:hypothetical protein
MFDAGLDHRGVLRQRRAWLFGPLLAMSLAVQAGAEPRVTQTIGEPYVPRGYMLQLTEDCEIVSRGGPPDAHLRCTPGLGWRLNDDAGVLIFPKAGYLPQDADWAFAEDHAVAFATRGRVTLVDLPSGTAQGTQFSHLVPLHVEGAGVAALLWRPSIGDAPAVAAPLLTDGSLGAPISGQDISNMDLTWDQPCREAMALAILGAERLPNRVWSQILRSPSEPPGQAWTCDSLFSVRFAGRGSDGRWWALDPLTFKPRGAAGFDSTDQALQAGN